MGKKIDFAELSEILKAIAHPIRLSIVAGLLKDECNVSKIQERLGLPQSTVSQHLAVLRRNGVVRARREGVKVCYQVTNPRIRKMVEAMIRDAE